MKNVILVLSIVATVFISHGQNSFMENIKGDSTETVFVEGIDSIQVGGLYRAVALDTDFPAFQEVIDEAIRVLRNNGIRFVDQFSNESNVRFKNINKAENVYRKVIAGKSVKISWVISVDDNIAVIAFLFLEDTGFRFEVDPRYL